MSNFLLIREFPQLAATPSGDGIVPVFLEPPIMESIVNVTGTPSLFGPFQSTTQFVELCAQTTCSILFGLTGSLTTAQMTTGDGRLNANDRVIRRIPFSANHLSGFPVRGAPNGPQGGITNSLSVSAVICSSS